MLILLNNTVAGIKFNRLTTAYTINAARHLSTTAYLHRDDATNSVDLRLGPPVQIQGNDSILIYCVCIGKHINIAYSYQ